MHVWYNRYAVFSFHSRTLPGQWEEKLSIVNSGATQLALLFV
jgi:hypothetical protein